MLKRFNDIYEFGSFRFIPEQYLLLREGKPVPLSVKGFEILHVLIRNHGYIVGKDELMREVWSNLAVEESNLTQNISVLRKALGESSREPQYIETISRRGYRFIASVKEVKAEASDLSLIPQDELSAGIVSADVGDQAGTEQRGMVDAQVAAFNLKASEGDDQGLIRPDTEAAARPFVNSERFTNRFIRPRSKRAPALLLLAVSAIALIGLVFGAFRLIKHGPTNQLTQPARTEAPFQAVKIDRLTTSGKAIKAAISPDAQYIVQVIEDRGREGLFVRQVATSNNLNIIPLADAHFYGATFSHDGNYIYYSKAEKADIIGTLYRVPLIGSDSTKLVRNVESPIALSPDGERFAFVRLDTTRGERVLMVANADGSGERKLLSRKLPDFLSIEGPAWSPDGKLIAFGAGTVSPNFLMGVTVARVDDGTEEQITPRNWFLVGQVGWLEDGSGLVINVQEHSFRGTQLWHISYPDGKARKITDDPNDYVGVSLSKDSGALVTIQAGGTSNIWIAPEAQTSDARQITSGMDDGYSGLSWTTDGHIVFSSNASGKEDIYTTEEDGTDRKQLTINHGTNYQPSPSPDGRYIVFTSDRTGSAHIWRMDRDGGNQKQLTDGESLEFAPVCTTDSRWVIFTSGAGGKMTLWRVSIDGGPAVQLSKTALARPSVSPDGKLIACWYRDDRENSRRKLAIIPVEGGEMVREFDITVSDTTFVISNPVRWTPDGRALTFIGEGGTSNIWRQQLDGGKPVQLTHFNSDRIYSFDWSGDGKRLACARGIDITDAVLISNFR